MTDVSHLCGSGLTQISGASRIFLAATQQEGYIFYRQVKCDRPQLLPIARPLSLSSKNTAPSKAQIRSGSIANMPPTPSATNSPRYRTSVTISESDFAHGLPIDPIVLP